MSYTFFTPDRIIYGENAMAQAGDFFADYGTKALIVTGGHTIRSGEIQLITAALAQAGVAYAVFDGITGEPTDRMVDEGVAMYLENHCDFIIGFGGGSPLDTMKAIGALVSKGGTVADLLGKNVIEKCPPMIAIPTTAGTGSEATQFTIITDTKTQVKMLLKGPALMPNLAIVDPAFTMSSPKSVTVSTGLDALTHAIEAYTSVKAQPMTDGLALTAVKRIFENLTDVCEDGTNQKARQQLALAALEAGIAFNNSSVTLVHGMSRPIGALFHVPHGLSNAMLLPTCLKFALPGAVERFAALSDAIHVGDPCETNEEKAWEFLRCVEELCAACTVPTLWEYGVDRDAFEEQIEKMSEDALASGSPANTRRNPSKEDVMELYRALL